MDSSILRLHLSQLSLASHYLALLSLPSFLLSPHLSFILSLPLLFSACHQVQSQLHVHRSFRLCLSTTENMFFLLQRKRDLNSMCAPVCCCAVGSPLREDSPAGSLYALSASSPEHSLSSLSPPSSRHRIHREKPDPREPNDDHHTVNAPEVCVHLF